MGCIEGKIDRDQTDFMPMSFDETIGEDNPARVIDAFVEMLDNNTLKETAETEAALQVFAMNIAHCLRTLLRYFSGGGFCCLKGKLFACFQLERFFSWA